MIDNREDFFIREDQVLEGLNLEKTQLDEIINTIAKSDEFDWEESVHFRYVNKAQKVRDFARAALIVIAEYYESQEKEEQVKKVNKLLEKLISEKEQKEIDNEITGKTLEVINDESTKIIRRRNRHWLNYRDVKIILKTTFKRLDQAFEDIARSDLPLIIEEDFEDFEDERYYSYSGLERISLELSQKLTDKYRRKYVSRVPKISPSVIDKRCQLILPYQKDIDRAMTEARRQQGNKCQVTGITRLKPNLPVHHLYNRSTYPELAADLDNLLVITEEVHTDFHGWHEGYMKPCTVDDFIRFIKSTTKYGDTHEVLAELDNRKAILEARLKPVNKVLLLSASSEEQQQRIPETKTVSTKVLYNNSSSKEPEKSTPKQKEVFSHPEVTPKIDFKDTSLDRSLLGKECSAMINSKKQRGKILAIAHYHDRSDVCFQVNSEGVGIWINDSQVEF